jgi:4-hydroxybenzoate polyprenyltransferase
MVKKKTKQAKSKTKPTKTTKKEFTLKEKILGLAELGRPIEWSKTLLNMTLAALMVYYIYLPIDASISITFNILVFIAGFISVAFLWSSLYALNDYTDYKIDAKHETKKFRPIPSGKVSPKQGLAFSLILLVISFAIAFALSNMFLALCLIIMVTNQLLYTLKPWRLKTRKYFDIISGSMINPFFRYFSGIVLFVPATIIAHTAFPILPILFVVGIQFSGYTLYRLFSKGHDKKLKMNSTVASLPEKYVKAVAYAVMGIAVLSYFGILLNGFFKITWLGFLPIQYFGAIIIVAIVIMGIPSIRNAIINPQKADMQSSYRILYGMNIAFILGNAIIFFLLP